MEYILRRVTNLGLGILALIVVAGIRWVVWKWWTLETMEAIFIEQMGGGEDFVPQP